MKSLRMQLAEAEIAEEAAEDRFTIAKAQAEVQAQIDLERSTITKMTEAAQKRWITAKLPEHGCYVAALAALRNAHAQVLRLRAELDAERDARRERELDVQRRLLDQAEQAQMVGRTPASREADNGRVRRHRVQMVLRPNGRTPAFNEVENHR